MMQLGRAFSGERPRSTRCWRAAVSACAIGAILATPTHAALPGFTSGDSKAILHACATERAPLIDRQKQYAALKREKMTAAAVAGAKVGAKVLLSSGLIGMVLGGGTVGILSKALSMRSGGAANSKQQDDADMAHAFQAISVVVAIGGAVNEYVKVKQQQFNNDARQISKSIDADAGLQISVSEQTAKEMIALADCRTSQVADYNARLTAAASDKERKEIAKGLGGLKAALKSDIEVTEDVAAQQATMVKTFALARAMADAKSEADILEADAPAAGGEASHVVMQLPPIEAPPGQQAAAAPVVVKASYVTVRATKAMAAPDPRAGVVMNFPAGRLVTPKGRAAGDATWWEIEVAGTPGFIKGADLAEPGAPPATPTAAAKPPPKGRAPAKGAAPPPPPPPPPNPVRDLNRQVLAAKTNGLDRLKALNTDLTGTAA
jgi:hypothetical protein